MSKNNSFALGFKFYHLKSEMRFGFLIIICFPVLTMQVCLLDDYQNFLRLNSKSEDRLLDPSRFKKYCDTVSLIEQHSSSSYSLSLNEKADWFDHEVQQLFSTQFPSLQSISVEDNIIANDVSTAPESLNWASYNNKYGFPVVPLVQDQVIHWLITLKWLYIFVRVVVVLVGHLLVPLLSIHL